MARYRPQQLTRRALLGATALAAASGRLAPASLAAQDATPRATPASDAAGGLARMLALAPDVLAQPERPAQVAQYGNVPLQLAAVGAERPTSFDDPAFPLWRRATLWIALPDVLFTHAQQPEFAELFGFDILQVDEALVTGTPPETMIFLRGRFDADDLRTAWTGAGYQRLDEQGSEVFSLAAGPEIDLDNPVHQMVLARFNNATILADGTVVFAPTLDLMRQVLAAASGAARSLAAHPEVAALLATVDVPLAAAVILDGAVLDHVALAGRNIRPEIMERIEQELAQTGEMPPPILALFGITPGGPILPPVNEPAATAVAADTPAFWVIRLLMANAAAAATAAATIPNRIETLDSLVNRQPYADLVTVRRADALSDPPVVALDLAFVAGEAFPAIWLQAIARRDLLFLAY